MTAQMPPWLRWADDPWGIGWRTINLARRLSLRRSIRFLRAYARPPRFDRPVFIIGVPRSATTLVFRLLRASPGLGSLPREGHDLWRAFHHPRYHGWTSDRVGQGEVRVGERRFVAAWLGAYIEQARWVEKTPENALRVPYLLDLFPDARFIVIWRHPCDVIGSLIRGWRHPEGRFRSYFVPEDLAIEGYPHRRRWCFGLIDGWRQLRSASVPEVALAQWTTFVDALASARGLVPAHRFTEVWLEDLVADPATTLRTLAAAAEVPVVPALEHTLDTLLERPPNALSPPRDEKWRLETAGEIEPLLARIAARSPLAGYRLADDGRFTRTRPTGAP